MRHYLIFTLLSSSAILADELSKKADESIEKTKKRLPALEILPAGSILKKISIPRYNKDYTLSSWLTADQFEVISNEEIKGTNVGITLYDDKGEVKTRSILNEANYDQNTGLLTSIENLSFAGGKFCTSSQGVVLDWKNHRGFLLGKVQTIIYIKKPISMKNTKKQSDKSSAVSTPSSKSKKIKTAALAAVISSPSFLSAQDLAGIDQLSRPSTENFIQQLDKTKAALLATAEAEAKIAKIRKELTEKLGTIPTIAASQLVPPELVPEKDKQVIDIRSDKFLFDSKKGIFVYFGNVKITHPQYSFTCDGELKIILKESTAVKKLSAEERAKLKPSDRFDSVQQIIATKNVVFRGKDDKGRDVSATTQNLIGQNISIKKVEANTVITGDLILKGINSRVTTADGQLKVIKKNGYIKIDQDFNASGIGIDTNLVFPKQQ